VRQAFGDCASTWASFFAALEAATKMPRHLSKKAARAAKLMPLVFPEALAFIRLPAPQCWAAADRMIARIEMGHSGSIAMRLLQTAAALTLRWAYPGRSTCSEVLFSEAMRPVQTNAGTMTLDEWADLPEDEAGELVDGVLIEEEDVGALHESIVIWLGAVLRAWLGARGRILASDAKFAVSDRRGRKPDLTVYFTRRKLPAHAVIRTAPDVAIEIISPRPEDRRRDRFEKLSEYAAFGVRYYWLVDPEVRTLEVLERDARGAYTIVLSAADGQVAIPGCEGLVIDLDALWAEIDDLVDDA
jgi:Uma2 family endonuclease